MYFLFLFFFVDHGYTKYLLFSRVLQVFDTKEKRGVSSTFF